MANKRFGTKDEKGLKRVDVNLSAFAGVKTRDELKAEKGQIFDSLAPDQRDAAYEELADELGLPKASAPAASPSPAAPKPAVASAQ